MIKKQIKRRKKEARLELLVISGIYLFTIAVVLGIGIYHRNRQEVVEVFPAGSVFGILVGMSFWFFAGSFYFMREFNMAVSMGQTRKKFVWCYELVSVLEILAMLVLLKGFAAVEKGIYHWLLPEAKSFLEVNRIISWNRVAVIVLGVVAVQMLIQALLLRYGMKVYWVLWFIWMLAAYTPNFVSEESVIAKKGTEFVNWVIRAAELFGGNFWIIVCLLASGGFAGIAWYFLRRQQVTM